MPTSVDIKELREAVLVGAYATAKANLLGAQFVANEIKSVGHKISEKIEDLDESIKTFHKKSIENYNKMVSSINDTGEYLRKIDIVISEASEDIRNIAMEISPEKYSKIGKKRLG